MGSTEHTPGPWVIQTGEPTHARPHHIIVADHRKSPALPDHAVVASLIPYGTTESAAEEQFANARLIAAAPDMLEALETALAVVCYDDGTPIRDGDRAWVKAARAAIAEARGTDG